MTLEGWWISYTCKNTSRLVSMDPDPSWRGYITLNAVYWCGSLLAYNAMRTAAAMTATTDSNEKAVDAAPLTPRPVVSLKQVTLYDAPPTV